MTIVKNFFVFLVLLLLISCEDTRPDCVCAKNEVKVTNLQSSDGRDAVFVSKQKLTLNRKPFTGKIIDCYENKIRFRGSCKDGYLNGPGRIYSDDVTLINFKRGLLHGEWKNYSHDSSLIVKGHFKNHKQHGPICNYRNGLLWQKGTYINDNMEGPYYIYKKDGTVKTVIEFKKGIVKNCIGDCDEFNIGDDDYMMGYMVNYR
jgi:hypothetical protein